MLIALFKKTFGLLVGKLSAEKKEKAWEKFTELLGIIAEKGAEGAVKGAKE